MTRAQAAAIHLEHKRFPQSERRPMRPRVLVALHGSAAPSESIAMGRLVSSTMQQPLHGVFISKSPTEPNDVPQILHLPSYALEGIVLDVEEGDPAARLAEISKMHPTAFLVVGADPSAGDKLGVGTFAARVIEESSAPVLVVRPGNAAKIQRILVPHDGTPTTAIALEPAGDLARASGASLDILLVGEAQRFPPETEPGAMTLPQYVDQPHHEWPAFSEEFVERFMKALGHCPSDVPIRFFLGAGDPGEEILRYAEMFSSDLAVLVWHGHASARHGGVFQTVLRRANCSVLILRANEG
ncbi:MAG: universal stress protein [Polyangiaceae bacterium]|nr:universal stress protein [Polyangiaceae bacterium]